jgi:hypothetical protein
MDRSTHQARLAGERAVAAVRHAREAYPAVSKPGAPAPRGFESGTRFLISDLREPTTCRASDSRSAASRARRSPNHCARR